MSKIKAIISDADGTLVDTMDLIRHGQYETARRYLLGHGVAENRIPSYFQYQNHLHQVLGGSARETLERTIRLIYGDDPTELENMDFEKLHDLLNPVQDAIAPEYVKAMPGLEDLLYALGEKDINLAVFTSGTSHHIIRNFGIALPCLELTDYFLANELSDTDKLDKFGSAMERYFSIKKVTFVTCEDVTATKPDPESILVALDRLSIDKIDAMILGDHWVDMEAGVNAGVNNRVGVSHGFDDKETLLKAGAVQVIESLDQLNSLL